MKKLGSMILLIIMVLSVVPGIASDVAQQSDDSEDSLDANISGSRATIRNESVSFISGGTSVTGHLYYDPVPGDRPAIVFGVGYTAQVTDLFQSSNYGWIAEHLAANGYVVLVIRYAASYDNPMELLNLTGDYSLWVQQTRDAVSALKTDALTGATTPPSTIIDPARIALGGHSIGGAVSLVSAAQDRRIKLVFVMSPQNYAGSPRMNDFIEDMSPTPVLLQVGELDAFGGVATVQQSYNAASAPKELVSYRYGTYEGFTDIGALENIDIDDVPSNISDLLEPIISSQPLSTKQHDMSKQYTTAFLDYYLMNDDNGFNFRGETSQGFVITNPPLPPVEIPDVWHATVNHEGLDVIFQSASTSPGILDFQDGNSISVRARISPKGIWEDHVEVVLNYPEGATESYSMKYNDSYDVEAGYYSIELDNIPISHSLGTVQVNITAKDYDDVVHVYNGLSFEMTTSSSPPKINDISVDPDPIIPGEEVTFTIVATDPEGDSVDYFYIDFGDGSNSGWVESSSIDHTFAESGQYSIRARAKDEKAAESDEKLIQQVASNPPEADLIVDSSVKVGDALDMDGSGSSDPDGDSLEYLFTFGDGIESGWSTSAKVDHRYDETGEVIIKLKVRDEYGRESPEVQATVNIKENSDDSVIGTVTGSGGFPLIIIFIVIIIVVGGIFLLRGDEDEENTKGDPKKAVGGPGPKKPGKGSRTGKKKGVTTARSVPDGRGSGGKPGSGRPGPGQGGRPAGTGGSGQTEPQIDAPPIPSTPQIDAPPVGPSAATHPPQDMPLQGIPQPMPGTDMPPIPPTPYAAPAPSPAPQSPSTPPTGQEEPPMAAPVRPQAPAQPPAEPLAQPAPAELQIDAPPVEDDGEDWDDFDDGEAADSSGSDGGWEDEDFAIPVALKEKLNRESE